MFRKTKHIHFIGIGGIGMSGMAELLSKLGYKISGSDKQTSEITAHLGSIGINVSIKHSKTNIEGADVVVFSSAIKSDNIEILSAKENNIPVIRRAELLGELLKVKKTSIAIAGTHGKTTTSSMLGLILLEAKLEPTLVIGGIVNKFNTNAISGSGDIILVEADEFDRTFLSLKPTISVINNLDLEHLDCYKNISDLQTAFTQFANSVPFYGLISLCIDSKNVCNIIKNIKRPYITFGTNKNAYIRAQKIKYNGSNSTFELYKDNIYIDSISLNMPGKHNILNALGAISIALELNVDIKKIKKALKAYSGVRRRFELKYSTSNGLHIIDDYAHHPSEVKATIQAAKAGWNNTILSIFQPHLFTRTRDFYKDFAQSFMDSDIVIITDIYPAREKPIKGVSSKLITNELLKLGHKNVHYIPNPLSLPAFIKKMILKDTTMLIMGAGNIWRICENIYKEVK
jgi:UDP-N-acetylmuramate--alanine ligase